MSILPESSTWLNSVNQIEPGEILKGGVGNLLNQAASTLADRTRYLYDRLDDTSTATTRLWSASKIQTELNNFVGVTFSIITSNYTAGKNEYIFADTSSSSWTLTLPASPSLGDIVSLNDLAGTWDINNLTVARNGHNINGLTENLICDSKDCSIRLTYSNATYGWKIC